MTDLELLEEAWGALFHVTLCDDFPDTTKQLRDEALNNAKQIMNKIDVRLMEVKL